MRSGSSTLRAKIDFSVGDFRGRFDFEFPVGSVVAVAGPSGAGKTSLLRILAGLAPAARGEVHLGEKLWQDSQRGVFLAPEKRQIGFVPQSSDLFPHLTVQQNILYGAVRSSGHGLKIEEVVGALGLERFLDRLPVDLSGGERQRVTLGRSLLRKPQLLAWDEPLSALDHHAKAALWASLDPLLGKLGVTVLCVSHALEEIQSRASHLLALEKGQVAFSGTMAQGLERMDLKVWQEENAGTELKARIVEHDAPYGLSYLSFAGGLLSVARIGRPLDSEVVVRIAARDVSITLKPSDETSILNVFPARIKQVHRGKESAVMRLLLDVGGQVLMARITRKSVDQLHLEPGKNVFVQVKGVALVGPG